MNRRHFLQTSALLAGAGLAGCRTDHEAAALAEAELGTSLYYIGACDWSIGKHSDVTVMELAARLGLDGVQVSLGRVENDMHLRQPEVQQAYLDAARQYGVDIAGIAIGELNSVPYKSDERTIAWVSDSINVAQALDCQVVLLAFFSDGDLKGDEAGQQEVIRRLKEVAPKAEDAGVILGIESWLDAEEHVRIMDAVGSPNVKVYYDVANSNKMGYDIYEEIRWLGSERICEFHLKENGYLLGQGEVDFNLLREVIDEIGYTGWMQIEGAIPEGAEIVESYRHNVRFVNEVFGSA